MASDEVAILDNAIYHCQQAAEKAVKAFLANADQPIERTHNIGRLIDFACELDTSFEQMQIYGELLTPYATAFRYPTVSSQAMPTTEQVNEALDAAGRILVFVVARIPKSEQKPPEQKS